MLATSAARLAPPSVRLLRRPDARRRGGRGGLLASRAASGGFDDDVHGGTASSEVRDSACASTSADADSEQSRATQGERGERETKTKSGAHFGRLVQQQAHLIRHRESAEALGRTEAHRALDEFWLQRGMRKQPLRSHLVDACLQVGSPTLRDGALQAFLHHLELRLLRLRSVVPGVRFGKVLPMTPETLHVDATVSAARLVALRRLFPGVNLVRLVERYPPLLTRDDAAFSTLEGRLQHLQHLLPDANVVLMVERHPSLLFQEVDEALARLRARMPGRNVDLMVEQNPSLILKAAASQWPRRPPEER